jgi:UDP-2,4-diacetamido-2,4,6-trideoxy-beta-L-altropyranose hydrolase
MRCLALAQAWLDRGGRAIFASAELSPALEARLQDENIELRRINASSVAETTWAEGGDWVVLDGYHFDTALQKHLAECGFRVLAIDDNGHSNPANAHLLLNPNLHACPTLHAGHAPHTELLLGPRFAPLRREFIHLQPKSAENLTRPVQRLLISLGGADPANRTLDVLRLVTSQLRADVHVRVIVGGSNPHLPSLHEYVFRQRQIELIVDARDMAQHYLWADAAILPASTSCLEAFRCGLPCILVASVDNQRKIAAHVRAQGLATAVEAENSLPAEDFLSALQLLINDAQYRVTQSVQTSRMVDGQGCRRILQAMDLYGSRLERMSRK